MSNTNQKAVWPGWETVRLIGRGSFGAVYEIERDVFGHKEKAAMKVITIPQNDSDIDELYDSGYDDASITATFKSYMESIVNEYTLMREMNGAANVVNCDDYQIADHDNEIGWDIYIRMELLTPLPKALDIRPPEEQVVQIAKDLCRALILCRKYGIIHRDIKPQNIFVSKNGDFKLGDFGIAKTMEKTTGGTKIGTYKYMAPEVYNNQPYNQTVDIYSLGLVLHWLLNERRAPFMPLPPEPAVATQEEEARIRRFQGDALPTPAHGSEALKRIILKACAYDPKDRYQNAEEMLWELEDLTRGSAPMRPQAFPEFPDRSPAQDDALPTVPEAPEEEAEKSGTEELFWRQKPRREAKNEPEDPAYAKTVKGTGLPCGGAGEKPEHIGADDERRLEKTQKESAGKTAPRKKKKAWIWGIVAAAVAICLLVVFLPRTKTIARGRCGENATWTLNENGLLTIRGSGNMEDYLFGNNHPWYERKDSIKQVVIKRGITSIGDYSYFCGSLQSVTIPESVMRIGNSAFYCCESLTSVEIPYGVTSIGRMAFARCSSLSSVRIPDTVTSIGYLAFFNCSSLTDIYFDGNAAQWEAFGDTGVRKNVTIHCNGK